MTQTQRTRLNPKWLIKMSLIAIVLLGLGVWGYVDATIMLPRRGERVASLLEREYLAAAREARALRLSDVNIDDPVAERRRLTELDQDKVSPMDRAKLNWLDALALIGVLDAEHTSSQTPPVERLAALQATWASGKAPKAIQAYDIPFNWLLAVLGAAGSAAIFTLIARVGRTRFRWDPETQRLTLPTGESIVPDDVQEFDKRKWDKFLVFLKIKPGHERLGGREIKLDLLRYAPLEDWILEMERTAFPAEQEEPGAADSGEKSDADAGDSAADEADPGGAATETEAGVE